MDRYSEIMLHDDISSPEDFEMKCPSCGLIVKIKAADRFSKCKRCGEIFYLEELENEY
ncbi:hypothetical protein [Acidaminobacter sp. JC074]|uniref:hypothetical protein n=1 Tax=Acidaminobacter sp. JC074 TaxID=2530199 RepID=UPI001F102837|nr:hypothetical protein [Acidaminobacter sp. JC074]